MRSLARTLRTSHRHPSCSSPSATLHRFIGTLLEPSQCSIPPSLVQSFIRGLACPLAHTQDLPTRPPCACSHLHSNVSTIFLECPPPVAGHDVAADFFRDPATWLATESQPPKGRIASLPTHLVMFDSLSRRQGVAAWLVRHSYVEAARVFHSHIVESDRMGTHLLVFRRALPSSDDTRTPGGKEGLDKMRGNI